MELGGRGGSGLAPESQTELNLEYQATQDNFLSKTTITNKNTPPQEGLNVTLERSV